MMVVNGKDGKGGKDGNGRKSGKGGMAATGGNAVPDQEANPSIEATSSLAAEAVLKRPTSAQNAASTASPNVASSRARTTQQRVTMPKSLLEVWFASAA